MADEKYCYWDVIVSKKLHYNKSDAFNYPLYCYYFDLEGKYKVFYYNKNKRIELKVRDLPQINSWCFLRDSLIVLNTDTLKLLQLDLDTLLLSDSTLCVKSLIR